jgi:Fic family protein
MILNHKEAIRYLIENAEKITINFETICTIHYLLADGLLLAGRTGIIRNHEVRIGGSTYIPLDNKLKIEELLKKICTKAELINDPYEQSFFLLVHIAYFQAFEDINKRTSRLSANIPLIKNNVVPLSFNDVSKEDYNDAMIVIYELNDVRPLASLYSYSYRKTCQQYNANVESLGFDKIRILYRSERRELLKNIIDSQLIGEAIQNYIEKEAQRLIPALDKEVFIQTVNEDMNVLTVNYIAGLGITKEEFLAWQKLQNK